MKKFYLLRMAVILAIASIAHTAVAQINHLGTKKITARHFKTGLQVGFWEVFKGQQLTLDSFGKRPTSRVGFDSWNDFEKPNGKYNFDNAFVAYQRAHNYGETVYGAINICFTDSVTQKNTIPAQYKRDIHDPATEKAALKFLKHYVANALQTIGTLTLTIDYEICSNYRLSGADPSFDRWGKTRSVRAAEWGEWYVKAARAARDTAAAMGMADKLKLMPIVNGNPLETGNAIKEGPQTNQWLVKVVDSSDYLAFDTYHSDPSTPLSSPKTTLDIIRFWIDSFSRGKDVIVTENGYNVAPSYISGVTRASRGNKTTGTIQQQDTFFRTLFDSLIAYSQPGGLFKGKLRSYNIWALCDNNAKDPADADYYFGIVGIDTVTKQLVNRPAIATVRNGINRIDTSATLRPYDDSVFVNSLPPITDSAMIALTYRNGDDFDYLKYRAKFNGSSSAYYLHVKTADTGNLMILVNNKWLYYPNTKSMDINLNTCGATLYYDNIKTNIIELYCTSGKFPFTQNVMRFTVDLNAAARQATAIGGTQLRDVSLYPNPAHVAITITGLDADKAVYTEVFNTMGQLVKQGNTSHIQVADLAAGVYQVKITQGEMSKTLSFVKE